MDKNNKNSKQIQLTKGVVITAVVVLFIIGALLGFLVGKLTKKDDGTVTGSDYDVLDCIEVGDYKNMTVSLAVSKDDIDSEIDSIREEHVTYVEKQGTVADGDKVYANVVGYINGKRADDTCVEDYVEIGSGDWLDGFEDALIGAKTGQTAEFKLTVPQGTYGDSSIDGKEVLFKVDVKYICGKQITPQFDDQFVKKISDNKYKTVDEYKEYLEKKLIKENENDKADYAWTDIMDASSVKKYPEDMMKAAEENVLKGYYDMAKIYGYSTDEVFASFGYGSEEEFRENDLEELTKDTVKENLLARAIAKKENLSYTEEQYQDTLGEEYSYNEDDYDSKEQYEKENTQYLKDTATMKIVKDWLAKNMKYTTK